MSQDKVCIESLTLRITPFGLDSIYQLKKLGTWLQIMEAQDDGSRSGDSPDGLEVFSSINTQRVPFVHLSH